jgi:hypothetical protein
MKSFLLCFLSLPSSSHAPRQKQISLLANSDEEKKKEVIVMIATQ